MLSDVDRLEGESSDGEKGIEFVDGEFDLNM